MSKQTRSLQLAEAGVELGMPYRAHPGVEDVREFEGHRSSSGNKPDGARSAPAPAQRRRTSL